MRSLHCILDEILYCSDIGSSMGNVRFGDANGDRPYAARFARGPHT